MIKDIVLIGLGGGVGSILRHVSSSFVDKHYSTVFPLGTFVVNIVGCIVIGLFMGLAERHGIIGKELKLLLITGFCGGYTTFSTFSSENFHLLETNNFVTLGFYIILSVCLGMLGVWAGMSLSKI